MWGNRWEQMGTDDLTPDTIKQLEQEQAQVVKDEIGGTIKEAQQNFKSDIIGLGVVTRQRFPEQWKKMQGEWDKAFPEISVEVVVESKIRNTGLSS